MAAQGIENRILLHPGFARSSLASSFKTRPLGLIDVGARGDVDPALMQMAGATAVLGFEPDKAEAERLKQQVNKSWASVSIEPVALAEHSGEARLYLASEPNNHSLRRPNPLFTKRYRMEKFVEVGSEPLQTTTLDHVLFDLHPQEPGLGEIIKVDTQGTELDILKGAARTLETRTAAVICEVEFAPIYQDQPLFSDVEQWMRSKGFVFFGFSEQHGRSRKFLDKRELGGRERLLWSDAIFFKDPLAVPMPAKGNERLADCLIVSALMLGFYDYALEVAEWTAAVRGEGSALFDSVKAIITDIARLDAAASIEAAQQLAVAVNANPRDANLLIGQFVDRRRKLHDYDDVPHPSPWRAVAQSLRWEPPR